MDQNVNQSSATTVMSQKFLLGLDLSSHVKVYNKQLRFISSRNASESIILITLINMNYVLYTSVTIKKKRNIIKTTTTKTKKTTKTNKRCLFHSLFALEYPPLCLSFMSLANILYKPSTNIQILLVISYGNGSNGNRNFTQK